MQPDVSRNEASVEESVGALALLPILVLFQGWSLSVLWGWFVAPLGAPDIGTFHGIGIAVMIEMFGGVRPPDEHPLTVAVSVAMKIALSLFIGRLAYAAMG